MYFFWKLFFVIFSGIAYFVGGDGPCSTREGLCGCVSTNKQGQEIKIDMSMLDKKDNAYFSGISGDGAWTYDINLCTGFTITSQKGCINVTGCQEGPPIGGSGVTPLGKPGSETFGHYVSGQPLQVTYYYVGDSGTRTMMILNLNCDKTVIGTAQFVSEDNIHFTFSIRSKYVCPVVIGSGSSGLSTGSILLIIFFVILIVYFVSGSLFMKYKKGATGTELVPNINFWTSLPGLIKDGCIFSGRKIKQLCQRDGYNDI